MLDSWAVTLAISIVLGFLAGLGIGGGSLLMLWLTMIIHVPYETARGINLLFFLPAALIACIFRKRQGQLRFKKLLPAILAGCAGAILFSFLGQAVDAALLKKPFGIILLFAGLRELFYRPRNAR